MAIEFRCTTCNKLLRTEDNTAGKQAKCPSCGTVLPIPAATGGGDAPQRGSDPLPSEMQRPAPMAPLTGYSPFDTDAPQPGHPNPGQPYPGQVPGANPYQSPLYNMSNPQGLSGPRSGPPWERDRPSFGSFIETVKLVYSSPEFFFNNMRREGGLGLPMGFSMIGGTIGLIIGTGFQLAVQFGIGAVFAPNDPDLAAPGPLEATIFLVAFTIFAPLGILLGVFLYSGIYHVMLMMLKGANFPFETTFRVVAYNTGAFSLLIAVPICGQFIAGIVQIVVSIIGLSKAQEISGGKASAAVLIPLAVCCGLAIAFYGAIIAIAIAAAAQ